MVCLPLPHGPLNHVTHVTASPALAQQRFFDDVAGDVLVTCPRSGDVVG